MAIKNINNIQSNIDYISSNIDINYLVQSLANLGQREGIKGSSIIYNYFTLEDIGEIGADYIIMYKKTDNIIYDFNNNDNNWTNVINFNDIQNITNINNKIINNISVYRNTVLNIKDDKLYHFSCGEVLGSDKNEIIYNIYDLKQNIIEYAVRSFYLYNDGVSNYYCMLEIEKDKNSGVISRLGGNAINYKLNLYLFNSSYFNNISSSKNLFEQCYYINDNLSSNINIVDIKNNIYDFSKTQLYLLFKDYEVNNSQFSVNNLYYDISNNTGFSFVFETITNNEQNNFDNIKFELNKELGLDNRISFLTNDILYLYPKLLQLYNEDILNTQSNKYKFILENIFNFIYDSLDESEQRDFKLYIPKNYKFRYQCDSKDKSKIYNSNNNFILLDNKNIDKIDKLNNIYGYCGETSDSKIINLYYEIEYNDVYNDYIIGVNIEQLYTLPYINYKNNWCLYGGDTDISAVGRDAGNPNIIIMHNYYENKELKHDIISGVFNNQLLKYDTITGNFPFNVSDFFPGNTNQHLTAKYSLPKIDKSNVDFLTYAIIVLITDVSCINNPGDLFDNDVNNSVKYLTSIWHIDTQDFAQMQNGYTQFTFIPYKDENDPVIFNLNKLFNISAFIPNDLYGYISDNVKINGKFINNFKLTNSNLYDENVYSDKFILEYLDGDQIKNNNGNIHYSYTKNDVSYFINTYNIPSINNNSNIALKFNSEVYGYIDGDNKMNNSFLMSNSIDNITATNYLYPKFSNWYQSKEAETKIESLEYMLKTANKISSEIYLSNGESSVSSFSYEDGIYENSVVAVSTEEVSAYNIIYGDGVDNYQKEYYEEYTFNNNVPTLNLSSVFVQDINVINRLNILSVKNNSDNCTIYNGYIGTRFTDNNKEHLVIGTSKKNININNTYLATLENIEKFNEYSYLDLEFDNINVGVKNKINLIDALNIIQNLKYRIEYLESFLNITPTTTTIDLPFSTTTSSLPS